VPPTDRPEQGSTTTLYPLAPKPGIQRDGTQFAGDRWVDGRWTRFQRMLPRKMGGFRSISQAFQGPIRNVLMHADSNVNRLYVGSTTRLEFSDLSNDGVGSGISDRTPVDLIPSDDNIWSFAELIDGVGGPSQLLAHAAPNLSSIASTEMRKIYYGDIDGSDPLIVAGDAPEVSGGILAAAPYAIAYGDDGYVANSAPNLPADWSGAGSNEANITKSKIVFGAQTRGGAGVSPAFNLWSLDSVIRATFAGGSGVFDYDTITSQSSVLSSRGFIEYDGIWMWAGVDRFMMYNGTVQEIPNDQNINWFYDNLNWSMRQKVWATKVPRYGEVWFWFPYGNSVDCNAAVIINLREGGYWYDTGVGSGSTNIMRVHGYFPQVFRWPTWADATPSVDSIVRIAGGTPSTSEQPAAATISSITWLAGVATVTTTGAHNLSSNMTVELTGQTPAEYSGIFDITVTGAMTFTYPEADDPGGAASVVGAYTVGNASFAFDNDILTQATQDAPDGNIAIDYGVGVTKTVVRVGFISASSTTLNVVFEYSDANLMNWTSLYATGSIAVTAGTLYTFTPLTPITARGFRMRETGGGTLNIVEMYLDTYGYIVHQHEYGVDSLTGNVALAIPAYIESSDISYMAEGPMSDRWLGVDRWVQINSVEVDFIQVGDMTISYLGRYYANSGEIEPEVVTFPASAWKVDYTTTRRQLRLRFTSNTLGGDFQMGRVVLWLEPADAQRPNFDQQPA
jgi:hypothetical protein